MNPFLAGFVGAQFRITMKRSSARPAKARGFKRPPAQITASLDIDPGEFLKDFLGDGEKKDKAAKRLEGAKGHQKSRGLLRQIAPNHNYVANLIRQHGNKCFFCPAFRGVVGNRGRQWQGTDEDRRLEV